MERKKSFLVVCVWLILGIVARTQGLRTGKSRLFPGVQAMTPWDKLRLAEGMTAYPAVHRQQLGPILEAGRESAGRGMGGFTWKLRPMMTPERMAPGSNWSKAFATVHSLVLQDDKFLPYDHFLRDNRVLPDDYYARHFGFFCRKEAAFEKTTRIPLRLRLGSLEYCNRLEGK